MKAGSYTRALRNVFKSIKPFTWQFTENGFKLIGRRFIMQQVSDIKHTVNTTMDLISGNKGKVFDWPSQSPSSKKHAFHLLKRRVKEKKTP